MPRIAPVPLASSRLILEPLTAAHATEMAVALADPALYEFTGGEPPTVDALTARYARLESRTSPDGSEAWLNWAVRTMDDAELAGYVQATVASSGLEADVAWVVATTHQGRGLATEAARTMLDWLSEQGVTRVSAWIHPEHRASAGVARRLGFAATSERADGEIRWVRGSSEA
ncbi:GNAT family N-acetyltransferase [Demequina salsinemoris]|uniref:GNAT family N-acetyltransferase n=1 Tax=Demequina salsinemoris TaxID=577470 RepID=UPI0007839C6C|nr:GNAT family N-acetyltransferase [Demequina salsinemoris]